MNTIKVISRYGDFFFFNMSLIKVETGYLHQETTSLLPSSFTLTLLMQRGNMVDELTWGLTTDGRNEKAQCQSHYTSLWKKERDTNQPLPARQGSWLHGEPSARFPPFHQLYSSSSNQLKDRDLICCHSSPACFFFFVFFQMTGGVRELLWSWCEPSKGEKFQGFQRFPTEQKSNH